MSPWKVHLESFKNVKDEAAAARQVANELQAELDSTKKDLEQITGRLDTVEVSRRLLDDKVRSLESEIDRRCNEMADLLVI
jgi:predicted nuclease with TOPRIM domain